MATRTLLFTLLILCAPCLRGQQPPAEDPRAVFERAQTALQNQDLASADAGFEDVLRLDPQSVAALSNLGVVYMRKEKYDRAIQAFLKAQKLNPSVPGISLNLGLAYYHRERFALAIPEFAQVLQAQPGSYQGRYLLGMSYFLNDDYQLGAQTLEPLANGGRPKLNQGGFHDQYGSQRVS